MTEPGQAKREAIEGELFRLLVENVRDYAIFVVDGQRRVQSWSAGAERLLGYREEEILGQSADCFFTPEDRQRGAPQQEIDQALATGRGEDDRWHVRKDGSRFWSVGVLTPLRDDRGQLRGFAKIMRDRTDLKRAEQARQESEQRFAAVVNHAPAVIFIKDLQGRYLMVNRPFEQYAGLPSAQIIGKTDADFLPPEIADRFRRDDAEVLTTGRLKVYEESFVYQGRRATFLTAKFPLPDPTGRATGVCGIATDITERKADEDRLREQTLYAETLHRVGNLLAEEMDPQRIMQRVTDETTALTGAQFGAFFYNHVSKRGEVYTLHTLAGASREAFAGFPMPRNTPLFGPTYRGEGVVRCDDVTQDPRFGRTPPFHGMPAGHLPVRSYLAVPVISRTGDVLGGLFFGHAQPGVFMPRHERLVTGIAAQAAIALDNARLYGQLQESEQRFRQLAEHITDVFWMADPHKPELLYVSPAYEQVWGRSCQSLHERFESLVEAVYPDDRAILTDALERQRRGETTTVEYRIIRPDGSVRWIYDRGFPVRDAAGQVVRVAGVAEDITERKRTEQDIRFLADASATLASLVDYESTLQKVARLAVPHFADWCAVDMLEPDNRLRRLAVAHVDPAKVRLAHELYRRYPPDPSASRGAEHVARTGQSERVEEITDDLLVQGARDAEHLRLLRELGLRSYMCVPLRVRGKTLGVITFVAAESGRRYDAADLAVAEDLAYRAGVAIENARLYQELREADRLKDEFLAMLAHELRNPLAPIRNALHIMKQPGAGRGTLQQVRDMAERQVQHMARLLDDLLDVSRISRGRIELHREIVDVAPLIQRTVEAVRPLLDAQRHELTLALPAEPLQVDADPTRLEQVLTNLLNNAAKYTDPGGHITLTAAQEGDEVVLSVRDTGIGIAPDMLPRIFDLFVQAERRLDRAQGGVGIGLTLVKRLVEMHGGRIEATSPGLGQGSTFVVRLPALRRKQGERSARAASGLGHAAPLPCCRILVVDDNQDAANSLAMLLRLEGQDVQVAYDGRSALALARSFRPQVILLDIGMPGMDGYEVARRLREQSEYRPMLLVALTGWGQEIDRRRSTEAGFDQHLVKPLEPDAVYELLRDLRLSVDRVS